MERCVRHVPVQPQAVVLVCRKCSRRLKGGGFGPDGDVKLAKALRSAVGGDRKARRAAVAVVEVGCLDLCPKDAVTVLCGDRPDDWLVVPRGTPMADVCSHLGLPAPGAADA